MIFIDAIFACIRLVPKKVFPALAWLLSTLTWHLARKERRQLFRNLAYIFDQPSTSEWAQKFARQCFYHQMIANLEAWRAYYDHNAINLEGLDELRAVITKAYEANKGIIIITGHVGSWELAGHFTSRASIKPIYALAKPAKSKLLMKMLEVIRLRMGPKILWTSSKHLWRDMLEALENEQTAVGFVMDQKPGLRRGPIIDFMGKPTEFVAGPGTLAVRTQCPVLSTFCSRLGPWKYKLITRELMAPNHGITDFVESTKILAKEIERVIKLNPEQWTWSYRRWRIPEPT